mmetsp:Transcript_15965/g.47309  ORF Transcript_15965/g.47309 Transcript_15965/m.47309 type:complete len:277 (-) Transcript_15965:2102-2932(-)
MSTLHPRARLTTWQRASQLRRPQAGTSWRSTCRRWTQRWRRPTPRPRLQRRPRGRRRWHRCMCTTQRTGQCMTLRTTQHCRARPAASCSLCTWRAPRAVQYANAATRALRRYVHLPHRWWAAAQPTAASTAALQQQRCQRRRQRRRRRRLERRQWQGAGRRSRLARRRRACLKVSFGVQQLAQPPDAHVRARTPACTTPKRLRTRMATRGAKAAVAALATSLLVTVHVATCATRPPPRRRPGQRRRSWLRALHGRSHSLTSRRRHRSRSCCPMQLR